MRIGWIAAAAGAAMCMTAGAADGVWQHVTDFRELDDFGRPVKPAHVEMLRARENAGLAGRIDVSTAFGRITRGSTHAGADGPGPALTFMTDTFEGLQPIPANLLNQISPSTVWTGASSGLGSILQQSQLSPLAGATTENAGGNSTMKLRGFSNTSTPPNGTIARLWSYNWVKQYTPQNTIDIRMVLRADPAAPARQSHETFVNAITTTFTSEASYTTGGFLVDRVLWGGTNPTAGAGLPAGALTSFYNLGLDPNSFTTGIFQELVYPAGHPNAGQPIQVPVNSWFKMIHEVETSGDAVLKIDFMNGGGEIEGNRTLGLSVSRYDRWNARFNSEIQNDACYFDNFAAQGVELVLPVPPPLECAAGQYLDDLEWLTVGDLFGQNIRWVDATSSKAVILSETGSKRYRQNNIFPDDRYRQESITRVPETFATPGNPFRICADVKITGGNVTVRGLSPQSLVDNDIITRLFIGREAPPAPFTPRAYIQINNLYNPIDAEGTTTPFDNVAVVGSDVADTGFNYPFDNSYRQVCFQVADTRAMTVSVGGTNIYTGQAFVNSIDRYALESENNAFGAGNTFLFDNLMLQCQALPNVTLPPFTLVYGDDLEWGIVGVTVGQHDDDGNVTTPFRWSSAANMPIQQGAGTNTTKVLRMENVFRDEDPLVPSDPNFASFTQATTLLPNVTASSTRGWAAGGSYMLTDGSTTRLWSPGQATPNVSVFSLGNRLAFSSVTQTLWYTTPNPAFVCPVVSGGPSAVLWVDSGSSLASLGIGFGQFFSLTTHKNLAGNHTYRINGRLLRDSGGNVVTPASLNTCDGTQVIVSKNLDIIFLSGGDDNTAAAGSILYADNVKAWALPCLGDTNDDGVVNFNDLNNVLSFFGQSGANIGGNVAPDANGDGVPDDNSTNFSDLNAVLSGFGVPCV
ncbi:MAG: hypothetical protein AB7G17_13410 [Phycisphaerales bacterium]